MKHKLLIIMLTLAVLSSVIARSTEGATKQSPRLLRSLRSLAMTMDSWLCPSAYAADKGAAPVAHWRFDEGGGPTAYDDVGANDGTLSAGAGGTNTAVGQMWTMQGKIGGALECDGTDDYVDCGDISPANWTSITVASWIKWDGATVNGYAGVYHKEYGNDIGRFLINGAGKVLVQNGNGNFSSNNDGDIPSNQWCYICYVYNQAAGQEYIYVNGQIKGQKARTGDIVGNGTSLWVGFGWSGSANYVFSGLIDDFKIYNYARTGDQIMVDYNAGMATHLGAGTDPNEGNPTVAYLNFDENTGTTTYDRSGNGNNGTITNATWAEGKYGTALNFDGSGDYVDLDANFLDGAIAGTVSMWFKRDAWTESYTTLFTKSDGGNWNDNHIQISRNGTSDYLNLTISNNTSSTASSVLVGPVSEGVWYHVAMTWNGTVLKGYLNGKEESSYDTSIAIPSDSTRVSIGRGAVGTNRYFDGLIDEVKIYNYARTAAQIAYDYNKGVPVAHYRFDEGGGTIAHNTCPAASAGQGAAPVGWWRMDEASWSGTANEVVDSSGNGKHGVRSGDATTTSSSKIGPYAGTFDGVDDYVSLPHQGAGAITVQMWMKKSFTDYRRAMVKGGGNGTGEFIMNFPSGGGFGVYLGGGTPSPGYHETTGTAFTTTDFYFLTWTYDKSTLKLYVNGVLNKEIAVARGTDFSSADFKPGYPYGLNTEDFAGIIDDVRIYNYVRTPEQIYNDYKNTHGTLVGDTKFVDGKIGKALNFDGSGDYVNCGGDSILAIATAITVSAWVNPDGIGDRGILSYRASTSGDGLYFMDTRPTTNYAQFGIKSGGAQKDATSTTALTAGTWYHLAGTYDGSNVRLYVNGVLAATTPHTGTIDTNSAATLWIGSYAGGYWWAGKIDDVRIYNYSRTADQVMQDYNAGVASHLGAPSAGVVDPWGGALPVGYWKMDENTGVLARDASGNNNNGTLGGDGAGTDVPAWTQGKNGPGLSFDGGDSVTASLSPSISATDSYTIVTWVKRAGLTGTYTFMWEGQTMSAPSLESAGNTASYNYYVSDGASTYQSISTGTLSDDVWHHIAAVYDETAQKQELFVNGVSKGTSSFNANNAISTFYIGSRAGTQLFFNGLIDDVRIYDYALTQAQVAWLYNKGKPVAHWRFDEATSGAVSTTAGAIKDDSGNYNGTASGTTFSYTAGKYGGALTLDGNDYVTIGNLDFGDNPFTVSYWAKTLSAAEQYVVSAQDTGAYDGYRFGFSSGNYRLRLSDGTNVHEYNGSVNYADGAWHHYAFSGDETNVAVYVDGASITTHSYSDVGAINPDQNLIIGASYSGSAQWFTGTIDDARIYNYARTAGQIQQDYNQGMAVRLGD